MIELEKTIGTVELPVRGFDNLLAEAHIGRMLKSYIAAKGDYTDIPYAEVQVLKQLLGIKAEE